MGLTVECSLVVCIVLCVFIRSLVVKYICTCRQAQIVLCGGLVEGNWGYMFDLVCFGCKSLLW